LAASWPFHLDVELTEGIGEAIKVMMSEITLPGNTE